MPWRGPSEPGEVPTLGFLAADWIENTLILTEGAKVGHPFSLYDEQLDHLLNKMRLDPDAPGDAGNDAFLHGGSQIIRGQKWGKDPILAALDLFYAFGPCNFAGWDADGEPVGEPHPSPWVGVAALNDLQANNTWLPLKAMVESSELADLPGVDVTQEMIRLPCGNPIEKLTCTAFGRLGGRFTAVSLTENGLMTATGEGGNTGKRSPLSFARTLIRSVGGMNGAWTGASNTWDPTERSHAQQVYEAKSPGVFMDARIARVKVDIADPEQIKREVIWLYGDAARSNGGHVSEDRLVREIQDAANGETEVRRFYLSEILAGERPLAETEAWAARRATDGDVLKPGEAVTLGFDGSRTRDATVLTACRIRDGRIFHLRTWVPADYENGWIPRTEVDQAVRDMFAGYDVWFLFADPFKWQDYLDVWAARWPKKVIEIATNSEKRMDQIVERFITAMRNHEISHDGDETLSQHVDDAVIAKGRRKTEHREDDDGAVIEHYLKVEKKRAGVLIDAAISMLLAYAARGHALEAGATTKTTTPPPPPESLGPDDMAAGGNDLLTRSF